jgi:hypothetical protein
MINKFYKRIHNKYSSFFKFIFFIRYLFAIFFIATALFLIIPNFFNYEKKTQFIKSHLIEQYDYEILKYGKIEFKTLPFPRLEFKNVLINLASSPIKLNVKNLKIYPKFFSIYNYENFQSNKIVLKDNNIISDRSDLEFLINYLFSQKKKLLFNNLELKIRDENKSIISLKNIQFANYGYNKNLIKGEVFSKKFKIKKTNDLKNIKFELTNLGISANINLDDKIKKDFISGVLKSKILNTNLKFNFNFDDKKINIYNSYFRSKNISFNNDSVVTIDPFLDIDSRIKIENINAEIFKKINVNKLLDSKNILKKINSKNEINFIAKKFSRDLIDELKLKIDLAYGRINYLKVFSISDHLFRCEGNINLLLEYPLLIFDCSIRSDDKKDFLKEFSIKTKDKTTILQLNVKGNLNILNKKINFKEILMNDNYEASKEDLRYFKDTFENIVFDKSFLEIFNLKKINKFILEIS